MKTHFSKQIGFFALLFAFALLVNTAFTNMKGNPPGKTKTEKVSDVKATATKIAFIVMPFDMPVNHELTVSFSYHYAMPANDGKPDNKLFQLIRAKQLKLHKATDAKAV